MKLLIDISEDVKAVIDRNGTNEYVVDAVWEAVHNAIPYDMLDEYLKRLSQIYNGMFDNLTKSSIGHWIPIPYELDYETDAKCSLCFEQVVDGINYKYCPNCGARMIKEVKE